MELSLYSIPQGSGADISLRVDPGRGKKDRIRNDKYFRELVIRPVFICLYVHA